MILIYGQEKTLIDNTIDLVYNLITQFRELNILIMDGENVNVESITNACETTPFMSDRRIIHIKIRILYLKIMGFLMNLLSI
ncbi:hypothetical protein [Caloramator sp. mosi_1]|uniref:hypothetical protein n=1 Tax=Caloramator sp. mosi_1 TaxID=3023090 RepID=UPI003FCC7D9E